MKFELDADEREKFNKWNEAHLKDHHEDKEPYTGSIGGRISFTITDTSIGSLLSVKCNSCKARNKPMDVYTYSLADMSDW